jgi:hypothetical protein
MRLIAALIALSLAPTPALAQSGAQNIYGPDGRYQGRIEPDGHGGARFFDGQGHYAGQEQGTSQGGARLFGPDGTYAGRLAPAPGRAAQPAPISGQ